MSDPLAILAGNSQFPLLAAKKTLELGRSVVVVGHEGETDPHIAEIVPNFEWVKLGQLQKIIDFFKKYGAQEVLLAGGITKEQFFLHYDPDQRALDMLETLTDFHDDKVLRAIVNEFEKEGLRISSAPESLPEVLAPFGILTKLAPDDEQWADIEFGRKMALELGRLDVGQCVVVKNRIVLALEAIEGTDEAIKRGAKYANGGAVIVKMSKPSQDLRFDLPTVGLETVKLMVENKVKILAIEAAKTLVFDQKEMLDLADEEGIIILGIKATN